MYVILKDAYKTMYTHIRYTIFRQNIIIIAEQLAHICENTGEKVWKYKH